MLMLDCDGTVVRDNQDDLAQAGTERVMNRRTGMFGRLGAALAALFAPASAPANSEVVGPSTSD